MDEFLIQSASSGAKLLFFNRVPFESDLPIEAFWVRLTDQNFSAAMQVYAGYGSHPAFLFVDMARQWKGWPAEVEWVSLGFEFTLQCTHNHRGNIEIVAKLASELSDWEAQGTVMAEAGQLDRLAREAVLFFGKETSL